MGTGEIVEIGNGARGETVAGKILVFHKGKGGARETFGSYYPARSWKAPKAMACNSGLGQTVTGALVVGTTMIYGFKKDVVAGLKTGDNIRVDADKGEAEVIKEGS